MSSKVSTPSTPVETNGIYQNVADVIYVFAFRACLRPEPDRIEEYPEKGNALSNNPIAGTGHRRPKVSSAGHNKLPEIRIV